MKTNNVYKLSATLVAIFAVLVGSGTVLAYENQSSNEKRVRVDVIPVTLALDTSAAFTVRLNTHSVPLTQDLTIISELKDDLGRKYAPLSWEGTPPGGHHRNGILHFPKLEGPAESVTLIIREIGGVERSFQWRLE